MKKLSVEKTASKSIVMGSVHKVIRQELIPDDYKVVNADHEVQKFEVAIQNIVKILTKLAVDNAIFEVHLGLVQDITLYEGVLNRIRSGEKNVQMALDATVEELVTIFEEIEDEYMRERATDIKDIGNQLMRNLKGVKENAFDGIHEDVILVAHDLTPSDIEVLNRRYILGFVTEVGGVTSHLSIMAKSYELPALVGMTDLMHSVENGDFVIMDANMGDLWINPDQEMINHYRSLAEAQFKKYKELEETAHLPAITRDGHHVRVCVNIGNVKELENAIKYHIDGVGLFRSEFLYMDNTHFPTEEEQFKVYKAAALLCPEEMIIRTLDIGGDKGLDYYEFDKEENPFLGWRAIRISLELKDMFKTQLRALLRASAFGNIKIMYPMVISLEEIIEANRLLDDCKNELKVENSPYNEAIEVGMMIETPASVICAENFAKYVDFFSIGTNDLTQYILAVDRGNQRISNMYNTFHPAVLSAIKHIIKVGEEANIHVGMCGEFAGDAKAIKLLLGMGLSVYSVSGGEVANIKNIIRNTDYKECQAMAEKIMTIHTVEGVMNEIEQ